MLDKNTATEWFEKLWAQYPRRLGKKDAQKHFNATVKTPEDYLNLQKALYNYVQKIKADQTEEQYIKHGSSWFNNWGDWVDYAPVRKMSGPITSPQPRKVVEVEPTEEERQEAMRFLANLKDNLLRNKVLRKIQPAGKEWQ
jgi:hypothetical protein